MAYGMLRLHMADIRLGQGILSKTRLFLQEAPEYRVMFTVDGQKRGMQQIIR